MYYANSTYKSYRQTECHLSFKNKKLNLKVVTFTNVLIAKCKYQFVLTHKYTFRPSLIQSPYFSRNLIGSNLLYDKKSLLLVVFGVCNELGCKS